MESFRIHMSRESQREEDLDSRDQDHEQKRTESGSSSVFMTEPGTNIDQLNEPPDVRRAWDDGAAQAEITRDSDGNDSGDWGREKENGRYSSDLDAYSDFEMIEDYDPKSGFTVRLKRRPFGGAKKTSYLIHGIQDDDPVTKDTVAKERKTAPTWERKGKRSSKNQRSKQTSADKKASKFIPHDVNHNKEKLKDNEANQSANHHRNSPAITPDSFFTVGLDQRDQVFSQTPEYELLIDVNDDDDDDDVVFLHSRFSEDSFSNFEFDGGSWSSGPLVSDSLRPTMPSPVDFGNQDDVDYCSSLSISPTQHDGYLADSEENADLTSLQAQIEQARSNTKKYQRQKDEAQDTKRRESKESKEKDQQSQAMEDTPSQQPQENDTFDRAP
ncbi:hypothetical protein OS493_033171 [Desmophyllum pertusum]|uniref:Uncharacterized protein n=1 Tax=Desmophyllum pertusum TaxID=174260 RepID=A0A9W9YJ16_9CNID|nr:hypothetical protein OS493_033171 [Desmophyllum pertusum]